MKVVREEIFGPVVTVHPFKREGDVMPAANDTIYGLGSGIWTKDLSRAHRMAAEMHAGTVWVNCYNVFDAALPFGGYKQSGWGREMGHEVLNLYTQIKSVCIRLWHPWVDPHKRGPGTLFEGSWTGTSDTEAPFAQQSLTIHELPHPEDMCPAQCAGGGFGQGRNPGPCRHRHPAHSEPPDPSGGPARPFPPRGRSKSGSS